MRETQVQSLGQEDPLEKEMATNPVYSSTLAWKIPWMGDPGRLQSMGSQRVRHDWVTNTHYVLYNLSATKYMGYNPGLSKEIINYFNLDKRRHSKICPKHILMCLQLQNQYLAQSLVWSKCMFKGSFLLLKVTHAKSEAIRTLTSPPTPPTLWSTSKTFNISTVAAGSSMVSESQTCIEKLKSEWNIKDNWVHSL